MIVFKCLNLPFSPTHSPEVVQKKGYREVGLFRNVPWRNSHLCFLEIGSSVHRLAAAAQSTWPGSYSKASTSVWVSRSDHSGTPGEVLSCAFLWETKISKDWRPTSIVQLASQASQALSSSFCQVLFRLPKYPMSSMCLASLCVLPKPGSKESWQIVLN